MKLKHLSVLAFAACSAVAMAQSAKPNPFARPAPGAAAAAPASQPVGAMAGMPVGMPQGMPMGMPGMAGFPGAPGADSDTITEDVQASRVGTINGLRIFRGSNTYMFQAEKEKKLVRHLIPQSPASATAATGAKGAGSMPTPTPGMLPSMIGKPAQKN